MIEFNTYPTTIVEGEVQRLLISSDTGVGNRTQRTTALPPGQSFRRLATVLAIAFVRKSIYKSTCDRPTIQKKIVVNIQRINVSKEALDFLGAFFRKEFQFLIRSFLSKAF